MTMGKLTERELTALPCLHESMGYRLHLQPESAYGRLVVVKSLRSDAGERPAERLANEYLRTAAFPLPGVRRARGRLLVGGRPALALDYVEGATLEETHVKTRRPLAENLEVAVAIAAVLEDMHRFHLVHRNLASAHILVSSPLLAVTLIGFGDASVEEGTGALPETALSAGILAYISPEQTGRINRRVDHRADLYSFGAVLYEVFTGKPPFDAVDRAELVYAHLAQKPLPPREFNAELPAAVSDMVMRLLAKNPDDRYQSAFGIRADLSAALEELRQTGRIGEMTLGQADYSSLLRLPDTPYGRQEELETLRAAVRSAGAGAGSLVLVSGRAGSGKTALAKALRQFAAEQGACFIAGGYESSQRHVPYAGLRQAFGEWIDLILTESAERLAQWKSDMLEVGGDNAGLLVDMLPRFKLVIGQQPPVPELGPAQAQHRFLHLLRRFVFAASRRDRPLVLFLDNLHWADQASLQLLDLLLSGIEIRPIVLVAAYRDDEVGPGHPLEALLDSLATREGNVQTLSLDPLPLDAVDHLIADALKADPSATLPLARLVLEKTGGNPLFVRQFLESLHENGLLAFEAEGRCWTWDLDAVRQQAIIGSVAELMAEKIGKLPEAARSMLALAACIGTRFLSRTLAAVAELPEPEIAGRLQPAVEAGLLRSAALPPEPYNGSDAGTEPGFEFLHDRVHQTAYALLPQKQRRLNHLRIGRLLMVQTPEDSLEECVLEIAAHFNEGFQYLQDEEERQRLVVLNLMAGRKARRAAAYQVAIRYLSMGIGLLPSDRWDSRAEPTLELFMEAVEAEYLSANFERAALLSEEVLEHTDDLFTRLRVHEMRILFLTAQGRNVPAIEAGLAALEELGIALAEQLPAAERQELAAIARRVETLERLPAMIDPRHLASLRILMHLAAPAERSNPVLLEAVIGKMVLLSEAHGNSPVAAFAYGWYGALLCGSADGVEAGYSFGRLSLEILRQFPALELEARVALLFNAYVRHWKEPVGEGITRLQEVFQRGIETGDLEYTSLGAVHHCGYLLCAREPLETVCRRQEEYLETIQRWRLPFQGQLLRIWLQTTANLRGGSGDPTRLTGELFDEKKYLPGWIDENSALCVFNLLCSRTMLQYLFGDFSGAVSSGKEAEKYAHSALGLYYRANHSFHYALALLALHATTDTAGRAECLRLAQPHIDRLHQWATLAPMNFAHKLALAEAEQARARDESGRAMQRFNDAVRLAREHGHVMDEALICEREAVFYSALGRDDIAGLAMRRAVDGFRSWGALRKVEDLERRFKPRARRESVLLDTAAVLEASHALSREVHLEQLLEGLMRIVIESAGAEKGVLIQKTASDLVIQASSGGNGVETMQAVPVETSDEAALSVINYVARTQSEVVLSDAHRDPTFGADRYIAERRTRSLLCLPIVYQGKLSGLLYLENNLASDVFTADRLELLKALASQAAISMANAGLYAELESNIAALRESEQKFRVIFDQTSQFIGMLSTDGIVLAANHTALQFAGVREEGVLGKPFWETPWWAHSAELQQRLETAVQEAAKGEFVRFEATHPAPDGQLSHIDFSLKPVTDAQGRVVLLIPEGRDITERRRADQERQARADHLANMDRVNRAIQGAGDIETMMRNVLDEVLDMFDCDRAFLMYPCDPASATWSVPMERNRPEYPGVRALNEEIPMDEEVATTLDLLLNAPGALKFGPGTDRPLPTEVAERYGFKSFMSIALFPKVGKPWQFGIHQCSHARIWTDAEEQLLQEIGWRLTDGLTSLLVARNLRESEERFRDLYENAPNAYFSVGVDSLVRSCNRRGGELLGWAAEELVGRPVMDFYADTAHGKEKAARMLQRFQAGDTVCDEELQMQRADGNPVWISLTVDAVRDADGRILESRSMAVDITERKLAEERRRLAASVFANSQEGILISDADNLIIDVNPAFTRLTGYTREEAVGRNPRFLSAGRQGPEFYAEMWRALETKGEWQGEVWNRRKSGEVYAELLSVVAVRDEGGRLKHYVGAFSDISVLKEHEAELDHIAHYDVLTSVPNRRLLDDRLVQAIARADRLDSGLAVCYLDLDGFKPINDRFGHEGGDRMLVEIARRLESMSRADDTVARLGGDEFVLLWNDIADETDCIQALERVLAKLAEPMMLDQEPVSVSASIGVTLYPDDNVDADSLLRHADHAMYSAKQLGKNRFQMFDARLEMQVSARVELLAKVASGLDKGHFELYYQPKVNYVEGTVEGVEALLRWRDPVLGLMSPGEFLPLIESDNLALRMGRWVLQQTVRQARAWNEMGTAVPISVNLSPHHLQYPSFLDDLRDAIASHWPQMPRGRLLMEIVESSDLEELEPIERVIKACVEMGIGFSLDDFGTGYSSLVYLRCLSIEELKIDQSFVRDMLEDPSDEAIVVGVIGLGQAFGLRVVAEGVEASEQARHLVDLGCSIVQGYGLGRPMPARAFEEWYADFLAKGLQICR